MISQYFRISRVDVETIFKKDFMAVRVSFYYPAAIVNRLRVIYSRSEAIDSNSLLEYMQGLCERKGFESADLLAFACVVRTKGCFFASWSCFETNSCEFRECVA